MKCPKCGYNSFEFLDACKKCRADLTAFKQSLGIRTLLHPAEEKPAAVPPEAAGEPFAATSGPAPALEAGEPSWELPADAAAPGGTEPFAGFDFTLPEAGKGEEEAFSFGEEMPPEAAQAPQTDQQETFGEFSFGEGEGEEPFSFAPLEQGGTTGDAGVTAEEKLLFGEIEPASSGPETAEGGAAKGKGPAVKLEGFSDEEFKSLFEEEKEEK